MKWYANNVGDFESATSDLTNDELACYVRLLNHYYATERPIPGGERTAIHLSRVCRAGNAAEQAAAAEVLGRFFFLEKDGCYHNRKADEEIKKTCHIMEVRAAAGKKGAATTNSARGKNSANAAPLASARPPLSTQSQSPEDQSNTPSGKSPTDAEVVLLHLNTKAGTKFEAVESNLKLIRARLKEYGAQKLCDVVDAKCKEWLGDAEQRVYLRPATLFNATKCAQYVGQLAMPAPAKSTTRIVHVYGENAEGGRGSINSFQAEGEIDARAIAVRHDVQYRALINQRVYKYVVIHDTANPQHAKFATSELRQ